MSKAPTYWNKAKKYLSKNDKVMKNLIKLYSDNNLTTRKNVFFSLCKSIIGQQISVAAANSVFLKFKKFPGFLGKLRYRDFMQKIEFTKMHGLGNDFVIIDKRSNEIEINDNLIQKLSDRRTGAGCDQLITINDPKNEKETTINGKIKNNINSFFITYLLVQLI